jgi:hypothetical protein
MHIDLVTVKQLQVTLKIALNRVETRDFIDKLGIKEFNSLDILTFRKMCKNSKLRNIYFRLIHRDFFTHVRMKKYKMTNSDRCPRCGQVETINHLLWECVHVRNIWSIYNSLMIKLGKVKECVLEYDDVYKTGEFQSIVIIKIKLIQELIQIERPKNWNNEKLKSMINTIIKCEEYNANINLTLEKFRNNWKIIENNL